MDAHGVRRLGVDHVVHMAQRERRARPPRAAGSAAPARPAPSGLLQLAGYDGQRAQRARVVVQLGGLLGRRADQPDVDERVGVEAPVPAAFGSRTTSWAPVRTCAAMPRVSSARSASPSGVGAPDRTRAERGACSSTGNSEEWSGTSGRGKSARATALVEVVGTAGSPDLPEDRSQHALMGPQLEPGCPIPPKSNSARDVRTATGAQRATPAGPRAAAPAPARGGSCQNPSYHRDGQVVRAHRFRRRLPWRTDPVVGAVLDQQREPAGADPAGSSVICSARRATARSWDGPGRPGRRSGSR